MKIAHNTTLKCKFKMTNLHDRKQCMFIEVNIKKIKPKYITRRMILDEFVAQISKTSVLSEELYNKIT